MHCRDYKHRFSAYLDGELSPDERETLRFHLKECLSCYRLWSSLQKSLEVLRRLPRLHPPEHLSALVMARLQDRRFRQRTRVSVVIHRWLPLGVGAAALLVISIGLWQIIPPSLTWRSFIPGVQKEMTIEDGSSPQPESKFAVKKRSSEAQPPVMVLKVQDVSRVDHQLESMLRSFSLPIPTEREAIRPSRSSSARLIDIQVQGEHFPLLIRELHKIGHLEQSQLESHKLSASKQRKAISIRIVVVSEKK